MLTGVAATGNHASAAPEIAAAVSTAIAARYEESGGARFGVAPEAFRQIVAEVVVRYAAEADEGEQIELVTSLHVAELVLARACAGGNDAAWEVFLTRFRAMLYEAAYRICRNDSAGRELADELYSELYGLPNQSGRRVCRFDYYMGRGSMEGWLRAVLSQQHVNRIRSREVSLDEQLVAGVEFAAKEAATAFAIQQPSDALAVAVRSSLAELA